MQLSVFSWALWAYFTLVHPFYISLTELRYNPSSKKMEVAQKIFWDDLEVALSKEAGATVDFLKPKDKAKLEGQVKAYLLKHTQVWVNGKLAPTIGNICMDMCMIDLDGIESKEGDDVILFGPELPLPQLCQQVGIIPYELLTGISPRVKRIYVKE